MSGKSLVTPAEIQENVLKTIGKDFAAYYGNPHLSSYMEDDEDDDGDDDTGSVRIRLVDDQNHQPGEFAAYYGNTRLSAHYQDDSDEASKHKIVNFSPNTTVFSVVDDTSENPYDYDDEIIRIARDVAEEDVEDITIFPETPL